LMQPFRHAIFPSIRTKLRSLIEKSASISSQLTKRRLTPRRTVPCGALTTLLDLMKGLKAAILLDRVLFSLLVESTRSLTFFFSFLPLSSALRRASGMAPFKFWSRNDCFPCFCRTAPLLC
jgi:hypothetical protein